MDQVFRAIEGNRLGSLKDCLRMTDFDEPLFDVLNRPSQEHGCTPLMYALKQPAILPEILEFLLESGSDTEAGPLGALHYAITCHQPCGVLKLLLDYKADIYRLGPLATDCPVAAARETVDDEKEVEGQAATYSLLHLALQVGAGREVFELLCREGGALLINNQNNADRETPMSKFESGLHVVCRVFDTRAFSSLTSFRHQKRPKISRLGSDVELVLDRLQRTDCVFLCGRHNGSDAVFAVGMFGRLCAASLRSGFHFCPGSWRPAPLPPPRPAPFGNPLWTTGQQSAWRVVRLLG